MSGTYQEARDDIFTMFKDGWDTTGHLAIYPDTNGEPPADRSKSYCRIFLNHEDGGQRTLSSGNGNAVFTRTGTLIFQIFVPIGKGLQESYDLAKIITDQYEGKSSPNVGVWFRNITPREAGKSGGYSQLNVFIPFQYDELK